MDVLFFYTDRFPYGKGEAFIENEIPFLEERFDKIFVIPTALTADTSIHRPLPSKFIVLSPANTDNLYAYGRPSKWERLKWTIKYMLHWCLLSLFSKDFWDEMLFLLKINQLRLSTISAVVRVVAPTIRNERHFQKELEKYDFSADDSYYLYSYWFTNFPICFEAITGINRNLLKTSIMRAHRTDLYAERREGGYIPLRNKSFEALDHLILISDDGYNYITSRYPEYKNKCAVSRLGTKDYGVGPDSNRTPFVLVSCSYVIPVKRVHRIVDALSKIQNCRIHWVHFGAGQDFEQLNIYAKNRLYEKDNISYELKGQFLNIELMEYYINNSVSLFVNVSESEGLPVSIMEAISFGIPVVATDVGGTSETFIDTSDKALLKKDFTTDDLTFQIERFYNMEAQAYLEKRKEARKIWEDRFNASLNYKVFFSTYFK